MSLSRLTLTNFRNYTEAVLTPTQGFVILTGANGAGKTNVLEAISLLAPGRGLRGAPLSEMARQGGQGGFGVSARLSPLPQVGGVGGGLESALLPTPNPSNLREGDVSLGTGALATAPDRRIVRINGAAASATALSEWLSLLWITPAMDRLFTDTPGGRRRFLDRLVLALHPNHAHHSARYEAAMRQRNRLLSEDNPDAAWLDALEAAMGTHGTEISLARASVLKKLNQVIESSADSNFPQSHLILTNDAKVTNDANDESLPARLSASRATHAAAGRTLIGPHTEDMAVEYVAKSQPATRCSTGEQKALLLGIVLAHADLVATQVQRRPILLLDEVAAHLDPSRRASLFARLDAGGGQVWLTGTERALFAELGGSACWFDVHEGQISAC